MNLRLILSAVVLFGITGSVFFVDSRREAAAEQAQYSREIQDLDRRFPVEKERVRSRWAARTGSAGAVSAGELNALAKSNAGAYGFRTLLVANDESRLAKLLAEKMKRTKAVGPQRLSMKSWEGFPMTIAFERLPEMDAFLVVEKVHSPLKGSAQVSPLKKMLLAAAALVGVLLLGLGLGSGFWRRKERAKERAEAINLPVPQPPLLRPTVFEKPKIDVAATAFAAAPAPSEFARFVADRLTPSALRTEPDKKPPNPRELLHEFGVTVAKAKDPASLESGLVTTTAKATKMPALFFRFDPHQGILLLSSQAGLPSSFRIDSAGLSFSLSDSVMADVFTQDAAGAKRDLSDQASLAKLLRTHFRISNFDAWPMIERTRPRSMHPSVRFLGVLVVAHARLENPVDPGLVQALASRFQAGSAGLSS